MKPLDLRLPTCSAPYDEQELATESLVATIPKPRSACAILPSCSKQRKISTLHRCGGPVAFGVDGESTRHLAYYGFYIAAQALVIRATPAEQGPKRREVARGKIIRACYCVASLFQWGQRTIGLTYFGVAWMPAASVCAFNLVDHMAQAGVAETFHTPIVVLANVSTRRTLAPDVVKFIWIMLEERKLDAHLDAATRNLFKLNAVDNWGAQDDELFDFGAYPNYAAISERSRDFVETGERLHEYAALHLV
ncbi:uncharacterized protein Z519_09288 [Cladophialophora bantiana CBS 173.52]|uniref:Uncharacterized protein n=1 Tax=Cladophialophora bantiana (strain ATCC 10958 / CBS 173.52 / CDC B-1940 / NIH 8579) TaxID=1442370 RepID=A0A0D2HZ31_CLAB1|nr:uncharacterized protein Z519_09288 [Cladophialophora bantiana CBS 173.52]KIW89859.1 hypothetical protein Z519_09288 [Cladophialophora bantiana CBS 173.52]